VLSNQPGCWWGGCCAASTVGSRHHHAQGLIDENVHFRHAARLINALTQAQKHYELLLFPDERHVPRGVQDKVFMEKNIAAFFDRCL
jgi:dipeptidyl aminopeptidase/acylaminoacyl peptidase